MNKNSRYLGALMIAPFIIFIFLGGVWLEGFTIVLSLLGLYEFYNALRKKEFNPISVVGYILVLLFYLLNNNFESMMYLVVLATFILLMVPVINLKYTFIDVAITLLGFLYVGVFFSFLHLVNIKEGGAFLVWLIFIGSWMTDTSAYYAGKFFGKHKLCPKVSPKKTIEGSVGGIVGATLLSGIFGIVIFNYGVTVMPVYNYFIIGGLCGVFSQFGDLVASSVKRYVGIKDYSNLIPGHGGILDRFDSILFSGVVVFYYLTFIIGI